MVADGGADRVLCGFAAWKWAASVLAVPVGGVNRELDEILINGSAPTVELATLTAIRKKCSTGAHVHLLAYLMREHFPSNAVSVPLLREHFISCFLQQSQAILDAARAEAETCRCVVHWAKASVGARDVLSGGTLSESVAMHFFCFDALGGRWEAFEKLGMSAPHSNATRPKLRSHSSGPRMIDYAGDILSSRSAWDAAPLEAGLMRAQGQTRSAKGNRA